ncbi:hypothetical protein Leryth_015949, partial [Lithospermum erythrorhizon]
ETNDLPDPSCRATGSCPASVLITGTNSNLGLSVGANLFPNFPTSRANFNPSTMVSYVFGTTDQLSDTLISDYGFDSYRSNVGLYLIQPECQVNSSYSFTSPDARVGVNVTVGCVQGLHLWRNSSSDIDDELLQGYHNGNNKGSINEIMAAFDILDSNSKNFKVNIWYNATSKYGDEDRPTLLRIPRAENMVSNAYIQSLVGAATKMTLEFVGEMPNYRNGGASDPLSYIIPLFFTWMILLLFPVIWSSLVYEKQQKLRIMMKMHGLGDSAYWMISYLYFLIISTVYMIIFFGVGYLIGLPFFRLNSYSVQWVFYLVYINLQISMAFLLSAFFSDVKTTTVVAYIMVFGTGLLGQGLFKNFIDDTKFSGAVLIVMELYPGFSLFRGLDELAQFGRKASELGSRGIGWDNLSDRNSGVREVLIIMLVEWLVFVVASVYLDKVIVSMKSVGWNPLFFLKTSIKKAMLASEKPDPKIQESEVHVEMDKDDVAEEKMRVGHLLAESNASYPIICNNLTKVYPGKDGNPAKVAVEGLTLALPRGECFGMLGPNGAGKTSFISMMTGLTKPTSGTASVEGLDLLTQMDKIYTSMGVCPQHDIHWDTLSGREHLLFYGRLKNLGGAALHRDVEDLLKQVNLFDGGVADKLAGKYSGGMKRRLSVAISLIGNPKIIYMDEPSTGLDPASRNMLWGVIKQAKKDRAIILTTHSMEEAEHICDRIGIFVDGSFRCLGNPEELKGRYGETYVFTMTTSPGLEMEVEKLVKDLSPNAKKVYHLSGTQKFELPKGEVKKISYVFRAVKLAKERIPIQAWGIADTSLEEVFIKVAGK